MSNSIQPLGGGFETRTVGPARTAEPSDRPEARSVDRDSLRNLSERIEVGGRSAEFSYDKDLDRIVVRIYSSETEPREVVRQIPPEEYVAFAARFREMLGLLFDERV